MSVVNNFNLDSELYKLECGKNISISFYDLDELPMLYREVSNALEKNHKRYEIHSDQHSVILYQYSHLALAPATFWLMDLYAYSILSFHNLFYRFMGIDCEIRVSTKQKAISVVFLK